MTNASTAPPPNRPSPTASGASGERKTRPVPSSAFRIQPLGTDCKCQPARTKKLANEQKRPSSGFPFPQNYLQKQRRSGKWSSPAERPARFQGTPLFSGQVQVPSLPHSTLHPTSRRPRPFALRRRADSVRAYFSISSPPDARRSADAVACFRMPGRGGASLASTYPSRRASNLRPGRAWIGSPADCCAGPGGELERI
jgi:hypothetical protein